MTMILNEHETLDCSIAVELTVYRDQVGTTIQLTFPSSEIKGKTLSQIGTALQRWIYDALSTAYTQSISSSEEEGT